MDDDYPNHPRFRPSLVFWVGLTLLVVGSGPLLIIMAAATCGLYHDPNPNPVGLGMLAAVTFWPGLLLIVIGLKQSVSRFRRARKDFEEHWSTW